MSRKFLLTERAFHHGAIVEAGSVIDLRDDERPGAHMKPWAPAAPVVPIVVDALSGATVAPAPGAALPKTSPASPAAALVIPPEVMPDPAGGPSLDSLDRARAIANALDEAIESGLAAPHRAAEPGFLVIDTETNGLVDPRLAAISMIFVDADLRETCEIGRLVRPDGWTLSPEAAKVNGLTMERLETSGCAVIEPLIIFEVALAMGRTIVAHNAEFDLRVMRGELRRAKRGSTMTPWRSVCTMLASRRLLGVGALGAAYHQATGRVLENAHDASADARACLELLRALYRAKGFDLAAETKIIEPSP